MMETYQNLRQIAILWEGDEDLTKLALIYQKTQNPVIIAKVYTDLFAFLLTQSNKYFYLTDSDKASFILEEIHKALLDYNPERKAKIQTLINTYVNRRLYAETSMLNHHKRVLNYNADSYEQIRENSHEDFISYENFEDVEIKDFLHRIKDNLTENELKYCKIVISENHNLKDSEIAKMLNISPAGVNWIKKSLKTKFQLLLA